MLLYLKPSTLSLGKTNFVAPFLIYNLFVQTKVILKKLANSQILEALEELQGWSLNDGMITKSYKFKDFREAFSVMTRIAFECEEMNHHPNWENVYNQLTIKLNTHDVGGITQSDLELAHRIERIVQS